jgi:magnesium-transporting ATPase (P-type)
MEEQKNISSLETPAEIPQLTSKSVIYLLKAAKWGKFLAILGFIVSGLLIAGGIIMSFVLNMVSEEMFPLNMPFSPKILSLIYIIIAGIFLIPVIFLNSFSNNAIKAVNLSSTEKMTVSLKSLKNLFVFVGISTVVLLALYTIILIVVGTAAFFSF